MNPNVPAPTGLTPRPTSEADSSKLVSLLALAAGAAAMPQTGSADIVYSNMNSSPVIIGYGAGGTDSFIFNLPGTAQFGFQRQQYTTYSTLASVTTYYRSVLAGDRGFGAPAGIWGNSFAFAAPLPFDATWSAGGVGLFYNVAVGTAHFGTLAIGQYPATGYDRQYLAWIFQDSSQGNAQRYGWVEISLSMAPYNSGGPNVTIWGYEYDDSGVRPNMGSVPEPGSGALFALGALALGSRGLRKWRQNRTTPTAS